MEEARYFKAACDELKNADCPLFGGEFREDLPDDIRFVLLLPFCRLVICWGIFLVFFFFFFFGFLCTEV